MTHLDVTLAARSRHAGRALQSASVRHRRLVKRPMLIVAWQLGAEPFSPGAIGWGFATTKTPKLTVPGDPRNRDLLFGALLPFSRWFNDQFEAPGSARVIENDRSVAADAPQVVVANDATVALLGRLGRRLAYLSTTGEFAAPPELIQLGRHLQFLERHAREPGQQLILPLTELLASHWATPLSRFEQASLAALDAFIEPPAGEDGFVAAARAERLSIGPSPSEDDDRPLEPLIDRFNDRRGTATGGTKVERLRTPIVEHYRPRVQTTWDLARRCLERERALPEADSVQRRWDEDRKSYSWHLDWQLQGGRRRTRQTPRQAAQTMRRLERQKALVLAEEACDDPVRMIPYLLDGKAFLGTVVSTDPDHTEIVRVRHGRRPLAVVRTQEPCLIPEGKELYWSAHPSSGSWLVRQVEDLPKGGSEVTVVQTSPSATTPDTGDEVCLSVHCTKPPWQAQLPAATPWTHQGSDGPAPQPIEELAA